MDKDIMVYGDPEQKTQYRILTAGPLSAVFDRNNLRYIRLGKREIIRRIYVAVRNSNWSTVPSSIGNAVTEYLIDGFRISFEEENRAGGVDFHWKGVIEGKKSGEITFIMDGMAMNSFYRNRLGICVLHPAGVYAGKECAVLHCDGTEEAGVFPSGIMPWQPFKSIRAITVGLGGNVKARVEFEGEVFEMEDQRNWSDDSYKTYSTPIELPMPVLVEKGMRIRQSVRISIEGDTKDVVRVYSDDAAVITVEPGITSAMPLIGFNAYDSTLNISQKQKKWLEMLDPEYCRIDIPLHDGRFPGDFLQIADRASAIGSQIDISAYVSDNACAELESLMKYIRESGYKVGNCCVMHKDDAFTREDLIRLTREAAHKEGLGMGIGAGTRLDFSYMNRSGKIPADCDCACFPICPQVHKRDNGNIMENTRSILDMVRKAKKIVNGKTILVTPVSLRGVSYRSRWMKSFKDDLEEIKADFFDIRQVSMLNACWTAAVIKYLGEGGADRCSFFETNGLLGIMGNEKEICGKTGEGGRDVCDVSNGDLGDTDDIVFPVYFIFLWLSRYRGGRFVKTLSSEHLRADALTVVKDNIYSTLIYNASGKNEIFEIGFPMKNMIAAVLDHAAMLRLMRQPELFLKDISLTHKAVFKNESLTWDDPADCEGLTDKDPAHKSGLFGSAKPVRMEIGPHCMVVLEYSL